MFSVIESIGRRGISAIEELGRVGHFLMDLGRGFRDVPTWGRILYDARNYLDIAPHWALFPGSLIFLTVLSINFIGDGLRDALDPRKTS